MSASTERMLSFMKRDGPGTKILLVDDDVERSSMLRQYFDDKGFQVTLQSTLISTSDWQFDKSLNISSETIHSDAGA